MFDPVDEVRPEPDEGLLTPPAPLRLTQGGIVVAPAGGGQGGAAGRVVAILGRHVLGVLGFRLKGLSE